LAFSPLKTSENRQAFLVLEAPKALCKNYRMFVPIGQYGLISGKNNGTKIDNIRNKPYFFIVKTFKGLVMA